MLHNHSRRSRRCGDCNRREATRPMTSWRPLHPYTYSLDLGGAAAAGVLQEGWRQETGAKGGASRLPLTFCLLRFRGCIWGSFPRPLFTYSLHLLPTPYTYSLARCRRRRGRSVSGSSPVSCLFISCKKPAAALRSAAETKHSGARRVAQDERLGWQRCAASTDLVC